MDLIACKRYDVYWVKLDPARGSELRKTRPAVIVSLDVLDGTEVNVEGHKL